MTIFCKAKVLVRLDNSSLNLRTKLGRLIEKAFDERLEYLGVLGFAFDGEIKVGLLDCLFNQVG